MRDLDVWRQVVRAFLRSKVFRIRLDAANTGRRKARRRVKRRVR